MNVAGFAAACVAAPLRPQGPHVQFSAQFIPKEGGVPAASEAILVLLTLNKTWGAR